MKGKGDVQSCPALEGGVHLHYLTKVVLKQFCGHVTGMEECQRHTEYGYHSTKWYLFAYLHLHALGWQELGQGQELTPSCSAQTLNLPLSSQQAKHLKH